MIQTPILQIFQLAGVIAVILPIVLTCCSKKQTSAKRRSVSLKESSVKRKGVSKSGKSQMPADGVPVATSDDAKHALANSKEGNNAQDAKKSTDGAQNNNKSMKSEKTQKSLDYSNKSNKLKKGQNGSNNGSGEEKGGAKGAAAGAAGDKKDDDKDKENTEAPPIVPMDKVQNKGLLDDFIEKTKATRDKEVEEMKTENSQQQSKKTGTGKVTFNEKKCELWETKNQETIDDDDDGGGEEGA